MSASDNNLLISNLIEFGLSDREAKIYISLLELEIATVNQIVKVSGICRFCFCSRTGGITSGLDGARVTAAGSQTRSPRNQLSLWLLGEMDRRIECPQTFPAPLPD